MITPEKLVAASGCTAANANVAAPALSKALAMYNITDRLEICHFIGQVGVESARFSMLKEGLSYSPERLRSLWPRRFPTIESARPFARNPQAFANHVYGGRMGNTQPGDGFRFHGRGYKQLTGRENYTNFFKDTGIDVVSNPDLLLQPEYAAISAAWFWSKAGCGPLARRDDAKAVTQRINGGTIGLADRIALTERAKRVF